LALVLPHNREFLFKFIRDRNQYRQLLWSSVRNYPLTLFACSVTSNHTPVLARSESETAISQWMQEIEG
jgi:REP element-mobilizing transposase RayT